MPERTLDLPGGVLTRQAQTLQPKLALVIPTLREAENISSVLQQVRRVLDPLEMPYEILVVDDNSCDGTAEIVSTISESDPRVRLLIRHGERGLSGAILHGWQHTDAQILGVMDADRQHPPALLAELLGALTDSRDVVIGSRYAHGGDSSRWNPARKFFSAAAIWLTLPLQQSHTRVKDPMSGFFLVRRRCLDQIQFQKFGFKLLLEILVRGRVGSIAEVPFEFGCRQRGASKANLTTAVDYARLLARLYASRMGWS